MSWKDCVDSIRAAAGRDLSDDEVEAIAGATQARLNRHRAAGLDPAAAAARAGEELANEARQQAWLDRRQAAKNALVRSGLDARAVEGREAQAVRALLSGVEGRGRGLGDSVDARAHAATKRVMGGLVADLRKAGLLKVIRRRDQAFERDVSRELWRIEDPRSGEPTGNAHALDTARILNKWQEQVRTSQNDAGAWIGKLDHYVTRQSHDMWRVNPHGTAGAEQDFRNWMDFTLPRLNPRTFGDLDSPAAIERFMRDVWSAITSGVHETANASEWLTGFKGPGNIAKRASQERKLHFRDADAWFDYNQRYGKGAVVDSVMHGLERGSQNAALMRVLGTNPEAMYRSWVDGLTAKARDRGDITMALRAHSDDVAQAFRSDVAYRSDLKSPSVPE